MENYHIYDEIGRGKFSVVYKARRKRSIEYVAVKSTEKSRMNKVLNEVRILHKLESGFILKFYNWYESRNHIWLIFEYCTGGDLLNLITQDKLLPEESVRSFGKDLMGGLYYLHLRNILYCDLKPSNILIDDYGSLKLSDYGLARSIPVDYEHLKQNGPGSPHYMAPELFDQPCVHSFASDIWSLGCVLYELRTGKPPFLHQKFRELARMIKENEVDYSVPAEKSKRFDSGPPNRPKVLSHPFWENESLSMELGCLPYEPMFHKVFPPDKESDSDSESTSGSSSSGSNFGESKNLVPSSEINVAPSKTGKFNRRNSIDRTKELDEMARENKRREALEKGKMDYGSERGIKDSRQAFEEKSVHSSADSVTMPHPDAVVDFTDYKRAEREDKQSESRRDGTDDGEKVEEKIGNVDISDEEQGSGKYSSDEGENHDELKGFDGTNGHEDAVFVRRNGPRETLSSAERKEDLERSQGRDRPVSAPAVADTKVSIADHKETAIKRHVEEPHSLKSPPKTAPVGNTRAEGSVPTGMDGGAQQGPVRLESPWDLVFHPVSDFTVRPIVSNKDIETTVVPTCNEKEVPFPCHSVETLLNMKNDSLSSHFKLLLQALSSTSGSTSLRMNVLAYLYTLALSTRLANLLVNSSIFTALVKVLRKKHASSTTVSLQLKNSAALVVGVMVRYATIIQLPSITNGTSSSVLSVLTSLLHHPDVPLRRKSVAALGELLFFLTTESLGRSEREWKIPGVCILTFLLCLKDDDAVVRHYCLQTLTNVYSQATEQAYLNRFLTRDVFQILLRLMEETLMVTEDALENPDLASTLVHALCLFLRLSVEIHHSKQYVVELCGQSGALRAVLTQLGSAKPQTLSRLAQPCLNLLNTVLATDMDTLCKAINSAKKQIIQSRSSTDTAFHFIQHHSSVPVLRPKAFLFILLAMDSPVAAETQFISVCLEHRLMAFLERAIARIQRDKSVGKDKYLAHVLLRLSHVVIEKSIETVFLISEQLKISENTDKHTRLDALVEAFPLVLDVLNHPHYRAQLKKQLSTSTRMPVAFISELNFIFQQGLYLQTKVYNSAFVKLKEVIFSIYHAFYQFPEFLLEHAATFVQTFFPILMREIQRENVNTSLSHGITTTTTSSSLKLSCVHLLYDYMVLFMRVGQELDSELESDREAHSIPRSDETQKELDTFVIQHLLPQVPSLLDTHSGVDLADDTATHSSISVLMEKKKLKNMMHHLLLKLLVVISQRNGAFVGIFNRFQIVSKVASNLEAFSKLSTRENGDKSLSPYALDPTKESLNSQLEDDESTSSILYYSCELVRISVQARELDLFELYKMNVLSAVVRSMEYAQFHELQHAVEIQLEIVYDLLYEACQLIRMKHKQRKLERSAAVSTGDTKKEEKALLVNNQPVLAAVSLLVFFCANTNPNQNQNQNRAHLIHPLPLQPLENPTRNGGKARIPEYASKTLVLVSQLYGVRFFDVLLALRDPSKAAAFGNSSTNKPNMRYVLYSLESGAQSVKIRLLRILKYALKSRASDVYRKEISKIPGLLDRVTQLGTQTMEDTEDRPELDSRERKERNREHYDVVSIANEVLKLLEAL